MVRILICAVTCAVTCMVISCMAATGGWVAQAAEEEREFVFSAEEYEMSEIISSAEEFTDDGIKYPHSMTEDDLAAGYITNALPHKPVFRIARPAGLSLPEQEKNLYLALRVLITDVADGTSPATDFLLEKTASRGA